MKYNFTHCITLQKICCFTFYKPVIIGKEQNLNKEMVECLLHQYQVGKPLFLQVFCDEI